MSMLRYLDLNIAPESIKITQIYTALESIIRERNNGRTGNDFIQIRLKCERDLLEFAKINGRSDAIQTIMCRSMRSEDHYK